MAVKAWQAQATTDKQRAFILKLWDEREHEATAMPQTSGEASQMINALLAAPRKAKVLLHQDNVRVLDAGDPGLRVPATEDGMYITPEGVIYKAQFNRAQGDGRRLYAKRLEVTNQSAFLADPENVEPHVVFVYEAGAVRKLTPFMRMTIEQAKAFGALYGTCCVCGRTLTKEESIEAGIGPICAGRL